MKKEHYLIYIKIVLVIRLCIFSMTLFTINKIKVVIQMHSLQFDPLDLYTYIHDRQGQFEEIAKITSK